MAKQVVTTFTDDLTGEATEDVATHTFVLDGKEYEIDLNAKNFSTLFEVLRPYVRNGRRVKGKGQTRPAGRGSLNRSDETAKIRAWAKENGYSVNDRGRVPAEIREAYEKASN
ncbi:Lsr2 family protein [Streptomyces luteireticuli]|uniref:histone-like nucleoid-structuring protein Lsr2 n=1 Tax=Streptomyces luteireticuli TaxID=173858 RepID=UPI003557DC35